MHTSTVTSRRARVPSSRHIALPERRRSARVTGRQVTFDEHDPIVTLCVAQHTLQPQVPTKQITVRL